MFRFPLPLLAAGLLAACGSTYSADEYAARAVQQANPVQQGTVAGSRRVAVTAGGEVGTAAGAAAGGAIGGAAAGGNSVSTALGAVGGALVGGLVGTAAERSSANTYAIEYIIRKNDGELVSVTQRDRVPIPLGTAVLVISGAQARVVPDYISSQAETPGRTGARRVTPPRPEAALTPIAAAGASPPAQATTTTAPVPPAPTQENLPPARPSPPAAPVPAPAHTPGQTPAPAPGIMPSATPSLTPPLPPIAGPPSPAP